MPRVADHEERRGLIAGAFQDVLAEEGLAGATFVRVAARAGVSVGLIQHYFPSRELLLRFAYQDCLARRDARIAAHVADGEASGRPISAMLLSSLGELLPLDAVRRVEFGVVQHLLVGSLHDPALLVVARAAAADQHLRVSTAVSNGKKCGEVAPDVDADAAASLILAATSGLAGALALDPSPPPVTPTLTPVLGLTFTGRCRHFENL